MRIQSVNPLILLLPVQSERGRGIYQVTLLINRDSSVITVRITNLQPARHNLEYLASTTHIEHIANRVIVACTPLLWAGFIRCCTPAEIRWEEEYPSPAKLLRLAPIAWNPALSRFCFVGPKDMLSSSTFQAPSNDNKEHLHE